MGWGRSVNISCYIVRLSVVQRQERHLKLHCKAKGYTKAVETEFTQRKECSVTRLAGICPLGLANILGRLLSKILIPFQ